MSGVTIVAGAEYLYTSPYPSGCEGKRYQLHRFIIDVPSNQQKVLVEALDGPDKGLWFTCSPANFAVRYKIHKLPAGYDSTQDQPPPVRVVRAFQ